MSSRDMETMAHLMRPGRLWGHEVRAGRARCQGVRGDRREASQSRRAQQSARRRAPGATTWDMGESRFPDTAGAYWMYRMVTTENPLEEKIALLLARVVSPPATPS